MLCELHAAGVMSSAIARRKTRVNALVVQPFLRARRRVNCRRRRGAWKPWRRGGRSRCHRCARRSRKPPVFAGTHLRSPHAGAVNVGGVAQPDAVVAEQPLAAGEANDGAADRPFAAAALGASSPLPLGASSPLPAWEETGKVPIMARAIRRTRTVRMRVSGVATDCSLDGSLKRVYARLQRAMATSGSTLAASGT
jgi:hypothetical protein